MNIEDNRNKFPGNTSNFTVADKTVDNQKVWEPASDYNVGGEYGKVRAWTFRSGHSIEIDETAGGERMRVIHPNGSYIDMQHDGKTIYRSNNNSYEVVHGDKNMRVSGAVNIHVSGDANIKVDGNATTEFGGDWIAKVGGNWNVRVGGNMLFDVAGTINFKN